MKYRVNFGFFKVSEACTLKEAKEILDQQRNLYPRAFLQWCEAEGGDWFNCDGSAEEE